jgi:5-histidylcysteine sulfoxide synthase/putative 4-mercaptohistidine N1-methyltranferase
MLNSGDINQKREEILNYFEETYDLYEDLFDLLASDNAFYKRPESLRHPLVFYFGHTATFFINKLILAKSIKERINPRFESMFAIGVDEMSWDDLNEDHYDWPPIADIRKYRQKVRETVTSLIKTVKFELPIKWDSPMWTILMGIEHEKIHLETSSVLFRQLDLKFLKQKENWRPYPNSSQNPINELVAVSGGHVHLGRNKNSHLYGWDNEYGQYEEEVTNFKASKFLVSNGEFLEFINDGGYTNDDYWTEEGLKWRDFKSAQYPTFWRKDGDIYLYRSLTHEFQLPLDWPVDVNYLEAKAFCNWKGTKLGKKIRLPSEVEWYRLLEESTIKSDLFNDHANINLNYCSSTPVNMFNHGPAYDIVGNVWQWTETPIHPFDNFEVHPLYDDFTTPTYDNKHNIFKGGSWISMGNEASKFARYAFRRHFFQHAGFRYIESEEELKVTDYSYESDTQISQYSEFHYGEEYFGVTNFPKKCAEICFKYTEGMKKVKALDLGCAVGRLSFELSKKFKKVVGIDFSARFIQAAIGLQEKGALRYILQDEGELTSFRSTSLEELELLGNHENIEFIQGDACNLKPIFNEFDLIFMGNLVDRLYDPEKLLREIHTRLNSGGTLIIASPYTWLTEYTPKEKWLGGLKDDNGETLTTTDAIDNILSDHFEKVGGPFEVEFVIRETKRKFQHTLSEFNIYRRRS